MKAEADDPVGEDMVMCGDSVFVPNQVTADVHAQIYVVLVNSD